jgi:hypothetical protein
MTGFQRIAKWASLFLGLALFVQVFNDAWTYAWFLSHQQALIEQYCINVDQPQLECHGQCHLSSVLAANDHPAQDQPLEARYSPPETMNPVLPLDGGSVFPALEITSISTPNFFYLSGQSQVCVREHFRPPTV